MECKNKKTRKITTSIYIIFVLTISACASNQQALPRVNLSATSFSIKLGEPLVICINYVYQTPQTKAGKDKPLDMIRHGAIINIKDDRGTTIVPKFPIYPSVLIRQDEEGLSYSGNFVLFFNHLDNDKRLVFDKPGVYTIKLLGQELLGAGAPKPLTIEVKQASTSEIQALKLLSDPNDFLFLEFASHEFKEKRPERISHLKKVVEQYEGTFLAKWCAARLGMEYFEQFKDVHRSFSGYEKKRQKDLLNGILFKDANKYLVIGAKLPDSFPLREEVLMQLVSIEIAKGNDEKANSILDELGAKYPKGKHGRKASQMKKELLEIQKQEKEKEQ
jgi:hypothetical protein